MRDRRRRFLVNKRMQFKLMAFSSMPMLLCCAALYYLIYYFVMNEMVIPEVITQMLLPALQGVNAVLIIAAPIILILLLRGILVYSNKIAGPIYRLERELDEVAKGDFNRKIKFRKGDELKEVAEKLNRVLEKIKS